MRRINIILIILFSAFWMSGKSQLTYKFVDSVSYRFYNDHRWNELTHFGDNAAKNGYDYYYFNMRIGIANYTIKEFEKAIIYFERALKNNSTSEVAKEYLFWSYLSILDEKEAKIVYDGLQDSTRERIGYKSTRLVDYISTEGGYKFTNNQEIAGTIVYFNAGLGTKLSPGWNLFQSYTYTAQNLAWGSFDQREYFLTTSLEMKNDWKIALGFHFANYKSTMNYSNESIYNSIPPNMMPPQGDFNDTTTHKSYTIAGDFKQNDLVSQLNLTKAGEHFVFSPHIGLYNSWAEPNYIEERYDSVMVLERNGFDILNDTTYIDESRDEVVDDYSTIRGVVGLDVSYYSETITLGIDMFLTVGEGQQNFNMIPYVGIRFSDKFSIWTYYFKKKAGYGMSVFNAAQLVNTFDKVSRYSLTGNIRLSNKASLYITYQHDNIEDGLSLMNYKLNAAIVGIKIKL